MELGTEHPHGLSEGLECQTQMIVATDSLDLEGVEDSADVFLTGMVAAMGKHEMRDGEFSTGSELSRGRTVGYFEGDVVLPLPWPSLYSD